jgi:hypothetical protein
MSVETRIANLELTFPPGVYRPAIGVGNLMVGIETLFDMVWVGSSASLPQ